MNEEIKNEQQTVTIPGLPPADSAYSDMIIPAARGTGDYALSVEQLGTYMQKALLPITKEERQKLESLKNAPDDWSGFQADYNAMPSYEAERWYFIVSGESVVAMYRGGSLVWAVPNLVGQFADDSTPDDWFWWPNGVKTALPVDPVTKRFSTYWPDVLNTTKFLFSGGSTEGAFRNNTLIRLEKIPLAKSYSTMLYNMAALDLYPVLDCAEIALQFGLYYTATYVLMNSSKRPRDVYFRNTEKITEFSMAINNNYNRDPNYWPTRVFGLDLSRAETISNNAFGGTTCLITAINLGKRDTLKTADFRSLYWGDDTMSKGARQSVIDTLLTNSFDRAAAGYDVVTIRLSEYTAGLLTDAEKAAITAKGYTITAE